ncbi:MAG TPA: polysaccharide biosynthesis protein, partial [Pirellulales bacterium]
MTGFDRLLAGKRILVTGGTGSLGRALVDRLAAGELGVPERIVVLSRDEGKHHDLRLALRNRSIVCPVECRLGDVRSFADLAAAVRHAHIVVNAAALKQVPNCEYFPEQAVLTNTIGAANLV